MLCTVRWCGSHGIITLHAPPPYDLRSRRRKAAYYWDVTIILTIAAFVFSLLAFDPFRIGWKGYLYCLGIAIVTPFLLEQVLKKGNAERLFKAIAVIACAAALTSLMLLAVIRGDLFAEQMKSTASSSSSTMNNRNNHLNNLRRIISMTLPPSSCNS